MQGIRKALATAAALGCLTMGFGTAAAAAPVGDGWYPGYSQASPTPGTGSGTPGGLPSGVPQGAGGGSQPSSKATFGDGWFPGHASTVPKVTPPGQGSGAGAPSPGSGGSGAPAPGSGGGAPTPPSGSGTGTPSGSGSTGSGSATLGAQAAQMLALINQFRQSNGVGTLTANPVLTRLAQAKADDLATYHYFSHYSPRLGWPITQEQAAGFRATLMGGANLVEAGSIQRGFQLLTLSPPHRQNLLNPGYTQIGIGVAAVPGGVVVSEYFSGPSY